ncbi:hypothetical protein D6D02_05527 [Aureobasidium pullulans]|nr:hypothetical protein D6D02_05527 [Aureobasidium pullulans]
MWNRVPQEDAYASDRLLAYASKGNLEQVQYWLHMGANIEAKDSNGHTALRCAVQSGSESTVRALLERNADIMLKEHDGPLAAAEKGEKGAIVKLICDRLVDFRNAILLAAERDYRLLAAQILDADPIVVYHKDDEGRSPLSWAAEKGNRGIVALLLTRGDLRPWQLRDGLYYAARNGHESIVTQLRAAANQLALGKSLLCEFASLGDFDAVRLLLQEAGADPNIEDTSHFTPLAHAAEQGYADIVEILMKERKLKKSSILEIDLDRHPMLLAARNKHSEVLELLSPALEDVICVSDYAGRTGLTTAVEMLRRFLTDQQLQPLTYAVHQNNDAHVNWLFENHIGFGPNIHPSASQKNYTSQASLLLFAAGRGFVSVLSSLSKHVDPRSIDIQLHQMFVEAARNHQVDLLRALFTHYPAIASPDCNTRMFFTSALEEAAKKGDVTSLDIILPHRQTMDSSRPDDGDNAVTSALQVGHIKKEIVESLVNGCVSDVPFAKDLLRFAARSGYFEVVRSLLRHNIDVNACSTTPKDDQKPMALAIQSKGHGIVKFGSDTNDRPPGPYDMSTAIQEAAEQGRVRIIQLLLDHGADINVPANEHRGLTALQAAAKRGNIDMVVLLLDRGADVNALPAKVHGFTAIQAAARFCHNDILKLLLDRGADVNAPAAEKFGYTALQAATHNGHLSMTKLLLNSGADINAPASTIGEFTAKYAAGLLPRPIREKIMYQLEQAAERQSIRLIESCTRYGWPAHALDREVDDIIEDETEL